MSGLVDRSMMKGPPMSSKARERHARSVSHAAPAAMINPPVSSKRSMINGKLVKIDADDKEFLDAEIFIPLDRGYQKKISEYVTVVNDVVSSRPDTKYKFIPCPDAKVYPNDDEYQSYLDVYYNNQQFYIQNKNTVTPEDFRGALRELESWFVQINEPCHSLDDIQSWKTREEKRHSGVSHYCDPEARDVLQIRK